MASNGSAKSSRSDGTFADLVSPDMLWVAWLPVLIIGVFHYATGSEHHWVHDVLRRLYYVPILFAAFSRGLRGGLTVALFSSLTYVPHAFFVMGVRHDPGTTLNKMLEIVLYNVIGILAGVLADREAKRRRQAEQAFEQQRSMADQLVRAGRLAALGELVAGIAHEIRNPLHTIKGTAEIIDDVIPQGIEQRKMWLLLRQEVDHLERIAERFLSFARPSEPDLVEHNFGVVFERVAELLTAQVHPAAGVRLDVVPMQPELADRVLRVDRDQLAQVALNISSNALRAMDGHGVLRVEGGLRQHERASWLTLRLHNDGPTVPDGDIERIFDPFCTRSDDGTGLGLAIAERIAEAHGGFLEVENTGATRGVAFTLVLPETPR